MCWKSNKLKVKVAKKDIPVYKIVGINSGDKIRAYYMNFIYKLGVIYNECLKFEVGNITNIFFGTKGFHSYSYKTYYKELNGNIAI